MSCGAGTCEVCRWSFAARDPQALVYRVVLWCQRPGARLVKTPRGERCGDWMREPGSEC